MSASKSVWWISFLLPVSLLAGEGWQVTLPLTNPYPLYQVDQVVPADEGVWVAGVNDLYKIGSMGEILVHKVLPYQLDKPHFNLQWCPLAYGGSGQLLIMANNLEANYLDSVLTQLDSQGRVVRAWKWGGGASPFGALLATSDNAYWGAHNWIMVISRGGEAVRRYYVMPQTEEHQLRIETLVEGATGSVWAGFGWFDGRDEGLVAKLDAFGQVLEAFAIRPRYSMEGVSHYGQVRTIQDLPDGGLILNLFFARHQSAKTYSLLAEVGPDEQARWGQLYQADGENGINAIRHSAWSGLWGVGFITDGDAGHHGLMRFSTQGIVQRVWSLTSVGGGYYRPERLALLPDGRVALSGLEKPNLNLAVLEPGEGLRGCGMREVDPEGWWLGPVEVEVRPVELEVREGEPFAIWEEPLELWEGEGRVLERCDFRTVPPERDPRPSPRGDAPHP